MFADIAEQDNDYKIFYEHFGKYLWLGLHDDSTYQTRVMGLLRFQTTRSGDEWVSLKKYVDRMKQDQNSIYYFPGNRDEDAIASPELVPLCKQGYEVIFLDDSSDGHPLRTFLGKKLQTAAYGLVELALDDPGMKNEDANVESNDDCFSHEGELDDAMMCDNTTNSTAAPTAVDDGCLAAHLRARIQVILHDQDGVDDEALTAAMIEEQESLIHTEEDLCSMFLLVSRLIAEIRQHRMGAPEA